MHESNLSSRIYAIDATSSLELRLLDGVDDSLICTPRETCGTRAAPSFAVAWSSANEPRSSASSEANFNAVFQKLEKADKVGKKPASAVEAALLANSNTKIWVQKYSAERLTYLKDLDKTLYRVTCTGAQYTGGKYAALLDNKGPTKLD